MEKFRPTCRRSSERRHTLFGRQGYTAPEAFSVRSGAHLAPSARRNPFNTEGIVAVQVNADGTLAIEPRPGVQDPASFTGFSAAKRTYGR